MRRLPETALLIACAITMLSSARAAGASLVERGKYLFEAADCAACHENARTGALTGGRAFKLPFGTIYAGNITPDRQSGIGAYTDSEWLRMMQKGVARDGRHLYPVMPYTAYTLMRNEDALAIKAYLLTLRPAVAPLPQNDLHFPFNQRWGLIFWNWLFNPAHRMTPQAERSAVWNRGAYLAEALGHCSQCHTPRNVLYGLNRHAYAGSVQMGWHAYNITPDKQHGIGGWTDDAIVSYLSKGYAPGHGPASGPMAEAVSHSLRHMSASDVHALVVYLKSLKPETAGQRSVGRHPSRSLSGHADGARIFAEACAGCHLFNGEGRQSPWATLAGAHSLEELGRTNIDAALREGTTVETDVGIQSMPGFSAAYSQHELDAVADYLQERFGKAAVNQ